MPWKLRGKFKALLFLLPFVGADIIVAKDADLIPGLCRFISEKVNNTTGLAADFLTKLLSMLRSKLGNGGAGAWANLWSASLSAVIMIDCKEMRQRAVSYILPNVFKIVNADEIPAVSAAILQELQLLHRRETSRNSDSSNGNNSDNSDNNRNCSTYWSATDKYKFATLEVIRQTKQLSNRKSVILENVVSRIVSLDFLTSSLVNRHVSVRIAALQGIVASPTPSEPLNADSATLLIRYLPFSLKSSSPSVNRDIGKIICLAMRRLASNDDENKAFASFTVAIIKKTVNTCLYPSNVYEKEIVAIDTISAIADTLTLAVFNGNNKNRAISSKREIIIRLLFSVDVFDSVFNMLFSIWDKTRQAAFSLLKKILHLKRRYLGDEHGSDTADARVDGNILTREDEILRRALALVASPRQRESDSGSNLLQLLHIKGDKSIAFVEEMVSRLANCVDKMADAFANFSSAQDGSKLPMAHGLLSAVNMCLS